MAKTFLDIENAAAAAGLSTRHFRRKIEESGFQIITIGRKFFLKRSTLENWAADEGIALDGESIDTCEIDEPVDGATDDEIEIPDAVDTIPDEPEQTSESKPRKKRERTEPKMATESEPAETPVHSLQMPLTRTCVAVVEFHGDYPDKSAVNRLQRALDLMLDANTDATAKDASTVKKPRKLKDKGPCPKHPGSERNPATNRCIGCQSELVAKMQAARKAKAAGNAA